MNILFTEPDLLFQLLKFGRIKRPPLLGQQDYMDKQIADLNKLLNKWRLHASKDKVGYRLVYLARARQAT